MIEAFTKAYFAKLPELRAKFTEKHPKDYKEVVKAVVEVLSDVGDGSYGGNMDPQRIEQVDHGDYQGTLVFVIGGVGYQPSDYWYVRISYGSCSGCDTLEAISDYGSGRPSEDQVKDYMTLALHVIQGLGKMGGELA